MSVDANDWPWWEKANDRRQELIVRKHTKGDLTRTEEVELEVLQRLADTIIGVS